MIRPIVSIYHNNDFIKGIPYIYDGSSWVFARAYVYDNGWQIVGGSGVIFNQFIESANKNVLSKTAINFLVKDQEYSQLLASNNNNLIASDGLTLSLGG